MKLFRTNIDNLMGYVFQNCANAEIAVISVTVLKVNVDQHYIGSLLRPYHCYARVCLAFLYCLFNHLSYVVLRMNYFECIPTFCCAW